MLSLSWQNFRFAGGGPGGAGGIQCCLGRGGRAWHFAVARSNGAVLLLGVELFCEEDLKFLPKTPQPQENLSAQLAATEPHGRQPTAAEDARYHPSILGGTNRARTTRTAAVLRRARATMRRAACLSRLKRHAPLGAAALSAAGANRARD